MTDQRTLDVRKPSQRKRPASAPKPYFEREVYERWLRKYAGREGGRLAEQRERWAAATAWYDEQRENGT